MKTFDVAPSIKVRKTNMSLPALTVAIALACAALTAFQAPPGGAAQGPPTGGASQTAPPPVGRGGGRAGGVGAGPQRPPIDPAVLERGKGLYAVHCASCHGSEARGGESGPNLLRSPVILEDQDGELLLPIVKAGRPERGMPARPDLTDAQITDIAGLLRNLRTTGRDPGRNRPATIVVGNASEGEAYFAATCAKCHSVTGDLKGLATKYPEPRALQGAWLSGTASLGRGASPAAAPRTSITVTVPSGEVVKGEQARLDDFIVSLKLPDGSVRTFPRNGDAPKLEIHDPLQPHRSLVPTYRDRDIHNLTAYLVTLK